MGRVSPPEFLKCQSTAARRIWCRRSIVLVRAFPTGDSDRGEILDGAFDGKHLEICWIKNQTDALTIQIQGSARVRLEDGAVLRINYDGHNGYPFVPLSRILIQRHIFPRAQTSPEHIRDWMRTNPQSAEEVLRQN